MTTSVSDVVLTLANTSLLLVVYVLSDKLVTVPALVVVGDVYLKIYIGSTVLDKYFGINFYSRTEIEIFPPSPTTFSPLTVMRYEVLHDILWKITLVSNDSVIADDEMLW